MNELAKISEVQSMPVAVKVGDLLDESCDVLVTTANPWLNLSGGVNGAILLRGGESVQRELREYLASRDLRFAPPGTVVRTDPGPLSARHLLHVVTTDVFYATSSQIVESALSNALDAASELNCRFVAMPALATGYGRLPMQDFARSFARVVRRQEPRFDLSLVLRRKEDVLVVRAELG